MNIKNKPTQNHAHTDPSGISQCHECGKPLMWPEAVCTYCDQDYLKSVTELHADLEQNGRYLCPACQQRFGTPSQEIGLSTQIPWYQFCLHPKGCPHCKKLLLWKADGFQRIEKISCGLLFVLSFLLAFNTPENLHVFFSSWWLFAIFLIFISLGMCSAHLIDKSQWKHGENGVWIPHPVTKRSQAVKLYLLAFVGLITLVLFFTTSKAIATPIWFFLLAIFAAITASNLIRWHRNRASKRTQAS